MLLVLVLGIGSASLPDKCFGNCDSLEQTINRRVFSRDADEFPELEEPVFSVLLVRILEQRFVYLQRRGEKNIGPWQFLGGQYRAGLCIDSILLVEFLELAHLGV